MPSPSISAWNGLSPRPLLPHCEASTPLKPLLEVNEYHVPLDGRQTVMSVFPSPSKSPRTGVRPGRITLSLTAIGATALPAPVKLIVIDPLCVAASPGANFVEIGSVALPLPDAGATVSHG